MRNMIMGSGIAAVVIFAFGLWCCIRAGAMADRAMEDLKNAGEEKTGYRDRTGYTKKVIEEADQSEVTNVENEEI